MSDKLDGTYAGGWVARQIEIDALRAENERLKAEREEDVAIQGGYQMEQLVAENGRLVTLLSRAAASIRNLLEDPDDITCDAAEQWLIDMHTAFANTKRA